MQQLNFFSEDFKIQSDSELTSKASSKPPSGTSFDVETLGQVFTPPSVVKTMLALRKRGGRVLEPSCGDGAFSKNLPECVAIEFDATHAPAGSLNIDFFSYPLSEKFETVIGNPPYVRYQDIHLDAKQVREIKALLRDPDIQVADVAKRYGVSRATIYKYVGAVRPERGASPMI